MAIHRALYFVPYSVAAEHARHLQGPLGYTGEVVVALAPLVGGIALQASWLGPAGVFAVLAALVFLTLLPLIRMPDIAEDFTWSYRETVSALLAPLNRRGVLLSFFDGIQGTALLLVWPIAVFLTVGGSFPLLGLVMTFTLLAMLVVRRYRRRTRAVRREGFAAVLALSSWLLRFFASVPVAVVLVDVYAHTVHSPRRRGVDVFIGEQIADGGHFIDEYTAIREMGMALGRICGALLIAVCALTLPIEFAFAALFSAAGISAAVSVVISRRLAHERLPV